MNASWKQQLVICVPLNQEYFSKLTESTNSSLFLLMHMVANDSIGKNNYRCVLNTRSQCNVDIQIMSMG